MSATSRVCAKVWSKAEHYVGDWQLQGGAALAGKKAELGLLVPLLFWKERNEAFWIKWDRGSSQTSRPFWVYGYQFKSGYFLLAWDDVGKGSQWSPAQWGGMGEESFRATATLKTSWARSGRKQRRQVARRKNKLPPALWMGVTLERVKTARKHETEMCPSYIGKVLQTVCGVARY